ncbi:hypothetical protein HNY73_009373 [Argiope bruennichi]|uniref:Uncharacterized protein n=1 Tax=Argiope bruennichi TaxID=94029 RepID=A0A8T0FAB7_ARGBR|nr:hypothetical protein HNY73_009373 [Argiope bruennichi]
MESQVHEDLLKIIQDSSLKANTRARGFEYLLGLSATEEGLYQIIAFQKYIPFLLKFIAINKSHEFRGELAQIFKSTFVFPMEHQT